MSEGSRLHRQSLGGATVLTLPDASLPLVRFSFVLRHGSLVDPRGKAGRTRIMLELLLRGTASRSRAEWNRALERLGSQVGATVTSELALVHGITLERHLEATLELVAEALLTPAFDESEHRGLVDEIIESLRAERDDDEAIAELFWRRALYPEHPLGRRPAGEPRELLALSAADVRAAYASQWRGPELIAGFSGDLGPDESAEAAATILARLGGEPPSIPPPPPVPDPAGLEILVVDKPERAQAQLFLGRSAAAGSDDDVYAFWLGVTAFGGTFTSQFTREVRDERGWSYVAHAEYGRRRPFKSPLLLKTAPALADLGDCLELELALYGRLARGELEPGAIEFARAYLLNRYPLEVATAADLLLPAVRNELLGQEPEELFRVPERLEAIRAEEVEAALRRHLHPERVVAVIVATADDVLPELQRRFPTARLQVVDFREGLLEP